jgi:hypothetical protein
VQADEVRHAEVAGRRGPVDEGQARPAVGPRHAVRHVADHGETLQAAEDEDGQAQPHAPQVAGARSGNLAAERADERGRGEGC